MEGDAVKELAKEVVPPFLAITNVTKAAVGQIICGDNRGIFLLTVEHQKVVEVPHSDRGFVAVAFHISDVLKGCFVLQFCNDSVRVRSLSSAAIAGSSSVAMVATSKWWEVVPRL